MALKPDQSVMVGLATAALVYAIYTNATPTVTEIRAAKPQDSDVEASRKMAAWTATGVVAFASLITKDSTIFVLGGASVIALDWWNRHANTVDPRTGKATTVMNTGTLPVATQETDGAEYGYEDSASVY